MLQGSTVCVVCLTQHIFFAKMAQQQKSTQQQLCDAAEEGKLNDVKRLLGLHGTSINGKAVRFLFHFIS
jgi:hypothetical protein